MTRRNNTLCCSLVAAVTAACGGVTSAHNPDGAKIEYATVEGRLTTDASGSASGSSQFDSSGTLTNATSVQVALLGSDGSLQIGGQGSLSENGQFSLQVPAERTHLIIQAIDAQGQVLAAGILESSGTTGATVAMAPITTQTSVEAAVMTQMVALGASLDGISTLDLSQRIDASTAATIRAMTEAGVNVQAELTALAQASIAAQAAVLDSMSQSGITLTGQALFQSELALAQSIDAQLNGSTQGDSSAVSSQLAARIASLWTSLGVSAATQAEASSASSAAFRGVLSSQLSASSADQSLLTAASLAEASLEAQVSTTVEVSLLQAADASPSIVQGALAAGTTLQTQVAAATSIATAAQAFAQFQAAIAAETQSSNGQGSAGGSVLGQLLSSVGAADANVSADLQALLSAEAMAAATFDANLSDALQISGSLNPATAAQGVATAYSAFMTSVQAQAQQTLATMGNTQAMLAADLLVVADGSFAATTAH
jgi:hypothetical protein